MTAFDALARAMQDWAALARRVSNAAIDREWPWRGEDTDVRWGFFAAYSTLCDLANEIAAARQAEGRPASTAQRALALYHVAFRDLLGLLTQIDAAEFDRAPAAEEWPVRTVLEHIMFAEARFLAVMRYALERHRRQDGLPLQAPDDYLAAASPLVDSDGEMGEVLAQAGALHARVLAELTEVSEGELAAPVSWWYEADLRFHFYRFDAHLREHMVQIEKVIEAIRPGPSDALRTLRLIYRAWGEVEGAALGAPETAAAAVASAAAECADWARTIGKLLIRDAAEA